MLKNLTILVLTGALLPACIITDGSTSTDGGTGTGTGTDASAGTDSTGGTDDGIDRTGLNTQRAADAGVLVNDCNLLRLFFGFQFLDFTAEQIGELLHAFHAAGRAEIDIDLTLGDGFGIGFATGEAALATLRLGQDALDFFNQRVTFDLEFDRGKTECGAEHNSAERHDGDSEQNIHYWYLSKPAKPMKARAIKPAVTIAMADPRK